MATQDNGRKAMVLKFSKRRYDGGSEMELIQELDSARRIIQPRKAFAEPRAQESAVAGSMPVMPDAKAATGKKPAPRTQKILQALLMGPLQMTIALVGLLTTGLALVTCIYYRNESLAAQSRLVYRECLKTLMKGLTDTFIGPGKALQAVMA
ncbi:MAG: hypothetical protein AB7P76_11855 [Candidatus Melainabacteria bacterium]